MPSIELKPLGVRLEVAKGATLELLTVTLVAPPAVMPERVKVPVGLAAVTSLRELMVKLSISELLLRLVRFPAES